MITTILIIGLLRVADVGTCDFMAYRCVRVMFSFNAYLLRVPLFQSHPILLQQRDVNLRY